MPSDYFWAESAKRVPSVRQLKDHQLEKLKAWKVAPLQINYLKIGVMIFSKYKYLSALILFGCLIW